MTPQVNRVSEAEEMLTSDSDYNYYHPPHPQTPINPHPERRTKIKGPVSSDMSFFSSPV